MFMLAEAFLISCHIQLRVGIWQEIWSFNWNPITPMSIITSAYGERARLSRGSLNLKSPNWNSECHLFLFSQVLEYYYWILHKLSFIVVGWVLLYPFVPFYHLQSPSTFWVCTSVNWDFYIYFYRRSGSWQQHDYLFFKFVNVT